MAFPWILWNKKVEPDKVVYTRSKEQRKSGFIIMVIGLLLFFGTEPLLGVIVPNIFNSKLLLVLSFIPVAVGLVLIIFTLVVVSLVNFKLLGAKLRHKQYQIVSSKDQDSVTILN
jgi:hypothetical protein